MSDDQTYTISIKGLDTLLAKLNAVTQQDVIFRSLKTAGLLLAGWSKQNRLSGPKPQYLGVVTGRLRSSIAAGEPEKDGDVYTEKVGTNVVYAAIHEFGGRAGRNGSVLIPSRPFLRPAIADSDNQQQILNILTENINEALET